MKRLFVSLLGCLIAFSQSGLSEIKSVSDVKQLKLAIEKAVPGDIIEVADGSYDLGGAIKISLKGEEKNPIVLKSANRNKAVFVGDSRFLLRGAEHLIIEGFHFASTDGPAVELRGCNNVRVTRNIFRLKETKGTQSSWVVITGDDKDAERLSHHNRIDRNLFENKSELGNFITLEGTKKPTPQMSRYDRIDRNHFVNIGPRAENVLEAIRAGSSQFSLSSAFMMIEENLFERCDGDPEVISIKSSDNIIRNNTFRENLGVLSLRHGNRNTVEGNFLFGNGRTGSFIDSTGRTWPLGAGGIRFYGDSMKIINNYFEGLTGTKWDGTLAITSGNAEYGDDQPLNKHHRLRDAVVAFNTLVNNRSGIEIGYDGDGFQGNWWRNPPKNLTVANNLVVGSQDTLVRVFAEPQIAHWMGNIVWPSGNAVASSTPRDGIKVVDPKLQKKDGIWKLSSASPAIGAAAGSFPFVDQDIEGHARGSKKDVGADQFSSSRAANHPLTSADVGPNAK